MSGLLSAAMVGLGDGLAQSGQFLMRVRADEEKEKRLRSYEEKVRAAKEKREDGLLKDQWNREDTKESEKWDREDTHREEDQGFTLEQIDRRFGNAKELADHKAGLKGSEPGNLPLGTPGSAVPKSVFTDIRADYAHRVNPGDMALAAAASEGDEAFMRYIEETGQLGSLYEFAAKPPYGIDLRTGTYLDMNAQPQQGVDLLGGSGFAGAGASPTPARTSGEPAPQTGSAQPPTDQVGLLSQTEATPAQWDRSGGSSTPTRVPAQEAGASPAEKAIENHPDMAARVRARALLNEAQELLAADPGKQAVIEQALAKRLREMGIRL